MSKIDEGKMTIAHEIFNLESVAESITSIIYPQAAEKGITFFNAFDRPNRYNINWRLA